LKAKSFLVAPTRARPSASLSPSVPSTSQRMLPSCTVPDSRRTYVCIYLYTQRIYVYIYSNIIYTVCSMYNVHTVQWDAPQKIYMYCSSLSRVESGIKYNRQILYLTYVRTSPVIGANRAARGKNQIQREEKTNWCRLRL
jgi:hypothetical protein